MAQTEHGVGVSYKLSDGTMVWTRRDTWAEVLEDVNLIFGEEAGARLLPLLQGAWSSTKPAAAPAPAMTATEVAAELGATVGPTQAFETCVRCGALKDRWVPPGTSQKTGKPYPGFYGCSTPRCPGR
jgi:sugar/nucleoside kinase (ribokinase family)